MRIAVVTLFPTMFKAISKQGISGRTLNSSLVELDFCNPRDFATDRHRTVDDRPFGGGPGMLLKTEPLLAAIRQARSLLAQHQATRDGMTAGAGRDLSRRQAQQNQGGHRDDSQHHDAHTVYLSPQGTRLDHGKLLELARLPCLLLVCGRYQGIDARVIAREIDEEISLGDFVLSGGEIAAMAVIDALLRLQPGALGDEDCALQDSFAQGLLHGPQYTRPRQIEGLSIPPVLVSGDHQAIAQWRMQQSLGTTWLKRPDLLEQRQLDSEQQRLLEQFKQQYQSGQSGQPAAGSCRTRLPDRQQSTISSQHQE